MQGCDWMTERVSRNVRSVRGTSDRLISVAVDLTNVTHPRLLLVWAVLSSDARHDDGLSPDLSSTLRSLGGGE